MYEVDPEWIWWNGRVVPWAQATVHVTSETAQRGVNVFEGLRAYWQVDQGQHVIVKLDDHLDRLERSARLLRLPIGNLTADLARGVRELVRAVGLREHLYLRPTIYLDHSRPTSRLEDIRVGAFIACYPTGLRSEAPMSCVVSTWRRISDAALPTSAKVGAAYTAFRLARIDAILAGADEAILLNDRGTVAETGGAAVFIVRRRMAATPPLADGVLDGITRRLAIDLLHTELRVPVVERSIARGELQAADEVFVCGTLDEIRPVGSIDGIDLPSCPGPVTNILRRAYLDICEGRREAPVAGWLHPVVAE